jgi:hypothetical protein
VVLQGVYGTFERSFRDRRLRGRRVSKPSVPDALEFARRVLRFEPDERQKEVLLSKARRGILNCSRQWGKSTIAAVMALHRVWTEPEKLVLVASPTERQSREFVRKAKGLLRRAGIQPRGDGDNPVSIAMPNGSRIVGLPGSESTVRGFSAVSLLLIDEAAQVTDGLYRSLRPMLADGKGQLWLMSTPWGKRGFFYESWMHGGPGWTRVSVPATECPRISKEFLEEERATMGAAHVRQEYLCEFVGNAMSVFDPELLARAMDGDIEGLDVSTTWE